MADIASHRVVGTLLKVIPHGFSESNSIDESLQVLYILQSGSFLFVGYWQGYELTIAAGSWRKDGDRVTLEGFGSMPLSDTWPHPQGLRQFQRQFMIRRQEFTPVLLAEDELKGWSLLSWRGPFTFVSAHRFIEIRDDRLPKAWSELDGWIKSFIGADVRKTETSLTRSDLKGD